jgi:small redox-active disulfide protein 2
MAAVSEIVLVGPGCRRCRETQQLVREIVEEYGLDCRVRRISDFDATVALQVFAPPGVIVDGLLKSVGRVPGRDELRDWLLSE